MTAKRGPGRPRQTHCKHGHSLADAYASSGRRMCRACTQRRSLAWSRKTSGLCGVPRSQLVGMRVRNRRTGDTGRLSGSARHYFEVEANTGRTYWSEQNIELLGAIDPFPAKGRGE